MLTIPVCDPGYAKRCLIFIRTALVPLVLCTVPLGQTLAQTNPKASAEVTVQAEEFSRQRGELLTRLKALKSKIDDASQIINKKGNPADVARESIEEMRAIVTPLLAAVAENGDVAQLGASALTNAIKTKTRLERETQFSPEEREKLVNAWEKRIEALKDATKELDKARVNFLQLMTTLQSKEALIGEWAALKAQDEVIDTIRQLTKALNETAVDVSNFITWFEGAGV